MELKIEIGELIQKIVWNFEGDNPVLRIIEVRINHVFAEDISSAEAYMISFADLLRFYQLATPTNPKRAPRIGFFKKARNWLYMASGLIFRKKEG